MIIIKIFNVSVFLQPSDDDDDDDSAEDSIGTSDENLEPEVDVEHVTSNLVQLRETESKPKVCHCGPNAGMYSN